MMDQFKEQGGFTLFELLLVIIIMSTITMAVAFSAKEGIDKVHYETTKKIAKNINEALASYAFKAARLPCPADPAVLPGNALYGRESRDAATGQCTGSAVVTPLRTTGFSTTLTGGQNRVLIGRLPSYVEFPVGSGRYVPLNGPPFVKPIDRIGNNLFLDPSGQLPRYAVTRRLAEVGQSGDYGNITLRDGSGANVSGVNDDARYVVVLQSYNQAGCTNTRPVDFENCDGDDSIFNMAKRSTGTDDRYFDDVVLFNNTIFDNRWLTAFAESNNAALYTAPTIRNIGIQTTVPQEKIHVGGVLRADSNVRAPLLCDPPSVVVDTTNQNINFNINIPQEKIVVKRINATGATTLVLGTDYTITGSSGAWVVGLTTPPAAGDTTRIEGWQCLDPQSLSVLALPQTTYPTQSGALTFVDNMYCGGGEEFSTTSLRAVGTSVWWNLTSPNETSDTTLLNISSSFITIGGVNYYKFNFRQPYIHEFRAKASFPYNMDTTLPGMERGRYFYLDADPDLPTGNGYSNTVMYNQNKKLYRVYSTLCTYYNTDSDPNTWCRDTSCNWSAPTSSIRPPVGSIPASLSRCESGSNGGMSILLVAPVDGVAPVAQNYVAYKVKKIDRYLAGISFGNDGKVQPVCRDLQIRNTVGATVDCGSRTIRGIYTDGNVLCN